MAAYVPSQIKADLKRQDRVVSGPRICTCSTPWARNTVHSRSPLLPFRRNRTSRQRGVAQQATRRGRGAPCLNWEPPVSLGSVCNTTPFGMNRVTGAAQSRRRNRQVRLCWKLQIALGTWGGCTKAEDYCSLSAHPVRRARRTEYGQIACITLAHLGALSEGNHACALARAPCAKLVMAETRRVSLVPVNLLL